ncbi:MAG TPA: SurA N-terminal domain-containing protein [Devosia sp.]|nr:SurA N-terminal domain-containing protein [Devosia sp.]
MLNTLRRIGRTFIGKVVGVLLIIGLAGFGISNVIFDLGSNTLAKVGNEDISTQQFQRAYQQQLNQVAQTLGYVPTNEQALQLGIPSAVISRLASEAAINQTAAKLGLGVSDAKLAEMVRNDPTFANVLGAFDRNSFDQILQQNGYTEAEYFDLQIRAARRQQMAMGLFAGSPTSSTAQDLLHHYSGDKRAIDYFMLTPASIPAVAAPTEDELKAYLAEHQADYRTKETRATEVLVFTPDILAQQLAPTDDEVAAEYERTKDQLVRIEKRQVQQVTMPNDATAKWFEIQRDRGVSFSDALKVSGLSSTDLGLVTKADIADAALADAAFALAKEGDFTIIAGIGNKRAVGVNKIEPGGQITLDEARADIAAKLALDKAKAGYADMQDQIEELRAAFKPLKEIADRFKLSLADVTLTADGDALAAIAGIAAENRKKVADAIFAAQEGKLSATVSLGANNNVYFELGKIEPARDQTFDEVKETLATTLTNERTKAALEAEAKTIVADLDSGTSIGVIASQHGQKTVTSQPFDRNGDGTPLINQQVATAAFLGGPTSHGWTLNGNGDYVVYQVKNVVPAEGEADAQTKQFVEQAMRDEFYAEFIDGLRVEYGLQINNQALATVLGLDTQQ